MITNASVLYEEITIGQVKQFNKNDFKIICDGDYNVLDIIYKVNKEIN